MRVCWCAQVWVKGLCVQVSKGMSHVRKVITPGVQLPNGSRPSRP